MLHLILGRGKSGKTTRLLQAVQDCPANGMAQRIVIVPEQLSHSTERKLSQLCGDSISFVSEVLSFTRLHDRVCTLAGGGARSVLDASGRILTANLSLSSIRHRLKVFASAAGKPEFLGQMVSMIDELKSYDITPKVLSDTAGKTTGLFSEKLGELSLILGAYEAVTAQGAADPRDSLTLLRRNLRESGYPRGRYFFVDGFTDFSQQELGVLEELLKQCQEMTVTLPCDDIWGTDPLFAPGRETARRLVELSRKLGTETEIITPTYRRTLPEDLTYLEEHLFSYGAQSLDTGDRSIFVSQFSDKMAECLRCGGILKKAAMEGVRYRDMMVCTGDEAGYGPLLEALFRIMDIPLYRTEKRSVLSHPAVAFVLLAIEAATDHFETDTVIAYLKTGYSRVPENYCDQIENYAITWAIRGSKWQKPWTMHPDGYDGRFTPETEAQLEALNQKKDFAIAPLRNLRAGLKNAGQVGEQMQALYTFLEETELFQALEQEIAADTEAGRQAEALETAQIWGMLMECLQQVNAVLGTTPQKPEDVLKILKLSLNQYKVGTIPAVLDAVTFGGIDKSRGQEPKIMYVLGANEGVLPSVASGSSLLTERERSTLRDEFQIELAPDAEGNLQRQLLTIYSCFTAPTERLYLSYSQQNAGETLQKSFLVGRIEKIFPNVSPIPETETEYTPETAAQGYLISMGVLEQAALNLAIGRAAKEITALAEAIARGQRGAAPREQWVLQPEAEQLFGSPVKLTASKLDQLGNCPFSFFLNYGLKARVRKEATFDAAEFGTFIHYILEKAIKTLSELDEIQPMDRAESEEMVREHLSAYASNRLGQEEQTPRQKYLFERNGQEASLLLEEVSRELSNSEFHPEAFELNFGGKEGLPPLMVQGTLGEGSLSGFVDRADVWHNGDRSYLRIIDYKSGSKKFDYTELYGGVGMQMLLYLFALKNDGIPGVTQSPIPAGVLYVPAKRPFSSGEPEDGRAKGQKRSGLVLGEEPVLQAMEQGDSYEFMPVRKTKSGLGEYALSRQQFTQLEQFVEKRVGQAVDKILSGDFKPEPFYRGRSHDPCSYCDYGQVCGKDPEARKKFYQEALSGKEFWNKIGGDDSE